MPYITETQRMRFSTILSYLRGNNAVETPGDLSYLMSQLIVIYIRAKGLRFDTLKDVDGVLDTLNKEFYRRVLAPYEDTKIKENGDVFPRLEEWA